MSAPSSPRLTFPRTHRLRTQREFGRVYGARVAKKAWPLRVHGVPNDVGHCRLGLSVSRRVGNAVRRNRIKRRLREAFRLLQHDLPAGYDLVVVVMRHEPLELTEYQSRLMNAAERLERYWRKRAEGGESES